MSKKLESVLLAEPHVPVMFPCRTLTRSEKDVGRTLQVAQPKALNLEKDSLAEPWIVGCFRICPVLLAIAASEHLDFCPVTVGAVKSPVPKNWRGINFHKLAGHSAYFYFLSAQGEGEGVRRDGVGFY